MGDAVGKVLVVLAVAFFIHPLLGMFCVVLAILGGAVAIQQSLEKGQKNSGKRRKTATPRKFVPPERPAPPPPDADLFPLAEVRSSAKPQNVRTRTAAGIIHPKNLTIPQAPARKSGYAIPPAPAGISRNCWVDFGVAAKVQSYNLPRGMLYIGSHLRGKDGDIDPCLINPELRVDRTGDYHRRETMYWPSYSTISPAARGAYLKWLEEGACAPEADPGYVFLFYYGLERRAIIDLQLDPRNLPELKMIAKEVQRLLEIYRSSASFRRYATGFLDLLDCVDPKIDLIWLEDVPTTRLNSLPARTRIALGKSALDGVAISGKLALAWARSDPQFERPVEMEQHAETFDARFLGLYRSMFGEGLVVAPNRTKISMSYRPASKGFGGRDCFVPLSRDYPDITLLAGPTAKIQAIIDETHLTVGAYGRFVSRNPGSEGTMQSLGLLPTSMWPEQPKFELDRIKTQITFEPVVTRFETFLHWFAGAGVTREQFKQFLRVLSSDGVGLEPDVLGGARMPKEGDNVCLFSLPPGVVDATSPAFLSALIMLEVGAAIAHADGEFRLIEMEQLALQIENWAGVNASERARLQARASMLSKMSTQVPQLKTKIAGLSQDLKEAIASACSAMVAADGAVTNAEVKALGRLYSMLGLEKTGAFVGLERAAAKGDARTLAPASMARPPEKPIFVLDEARVRSLREETKRSVELLSTIFTDDDVPNESRLEVAQPESIPQSGVKGELLLALDDKHHAFVRTLLRREIWSRAELADVAADMNIMLDGALERINDAAFGQCDMPLTEGDDPVEINPDILELLEK